MKREIKNLKASIRARLQNKASETSRAFAEVLQYYGMERFLYRFSRSKYADKFILKGALMFTVWDVTERRPTRDIDFAADYDNKVDTIEKVIKNVCNISVEEDGLEFDSETVNGEKIKQDAVYEGVRMKFVGFLERAKIPMQVDVAFDDQIYPKAQKIVYPGILNMPEPNLIGYPIESVVSEKFEAMVKLGLLNSRMKDFYDVWLLMRCFDFDGLKLSKALKETFEHRKTYLPKKSPLFDEEIYDKGSDRQTLWKAFLNKNDIKNAPPQLKDVAEQIEKFLIDPIEAIVKSKDLKKKWNTPGPWK